MENLTKGQILGLIDKNKQQELFNIIDCNFDFEKIYFKLF